MFMKNLIPRMHLAGVANQLVACLCERGGCLVTIGGEHCKHQFQPLLGSVWSAEMTRYAAACGSWIVAGCFSVAGLYSARAESLASVLDARNSFAKAALLNAQFFKLGWWDVSLERVRSVIDREKFHLAQGGSIMSEPPECGILCRHRGYCVRC